MSLEPPEKLRSLQGKLYDKAKAEPGYRFYLLYDKIHRPDVLAHAYALARRHDGAPGVDGVTSIGSRRWVWRTGWQAWRRSFGRSVIESSLCDGC